MSNRGNPVEGDDDENGPAQTEDQLGHRILRKPRAREAQSFALYNRDEEFAADLIHLARNCLFQALSKRKGSVLSLPTTSAPTSTPSNRVYPALHSPLSTYSLFLSRASYQSQTVRFIGGLLSLSSPLLPRPALVLDYIPFVR